MLRFFRSSCSLTKCINPVSAGYNFPSLGAIKPYLEPAGQGPSALWARETAKRLRCKVCIGYPEIEDSDNSPNGANYYNSLLVINENGEVIHNYRKSFLYYTDETWAAEGSVERGFHELSFYPPCTSLSTRESDEAAAERRVATSFGICMDINPYKFEAPYTAWEFAHRVLDSKSHLVILSMAWLTLLSREELDALEGQPEMDTFNYWLNRFWPLIEKKMQHDGDIDGSADAGGSKKVVIVFANRAGEEPAADDTKPPARYAGTSAVIAVTQRPRSERSSREGREDGAAEESAFDVKILCWDLLGAAEEGICFADTTGDPRMVFALKSKARSRSESE